MLPQPLANFWQCNHRRFLCLASLSIQPPCAVLACLTVATADGSLALLRVIVAPLLTGPSEQLVQVHTIAVEEECRMHYVVVVTAVLVHQSPPGQRFLHPWPGIVYAHRMCAGRILPSWLPSLLFGREVGRKNLLVSNHERLRLPVHIHLSIVGQPAQPGVFAALRVVLMAYQFSIVAVTFQESRRPRRSRQR